MIRILVSACLLGERVRYDGGDARLDDPRLERWLSEGRLIALCPEVEGGLGTPRPPAEIRDGDGRAVLDGLAEVVTRDGEAVTDAFVRGAEDALAAARAGNARLAILTERSPSCGSSRIYDGTFSGVTREGSGVTTALLEKHGIRVFSPSETGAAEAYLDSLSDGSPRGSRPGDLE